MQIMVPMPVHDPRFMLRTALRGFESARQRFLSVATPGAAPKTSSYLYLKLSGGPSPRTVASRTSPVPVKATAPIRVTIGLLEVKIRMAKSSMV
jgi:hypothetical protein